MEVLVEKGFDEKDNLLKYNEQDNEPDPNEPDASNSEVSSNSTEESARAEEELLERDCLAIILDLSNADRSTEVYYQTLIQEDDIILVVTPEIMGQIQEKAYYFEEHSIPKWPSRIWFCLTDPVNGIQFMAITEVPEDFDHWYNVPGIKGSECDGKLAKPGIS